MQPSGLKEIPAPPFSIGFDRRDTQALHGMWDQILHSQRWTEGPFTERFETVWANWNQLPSVAMASWSGAALAALQYIDVKDHVVLVPSNTFMATPLSVFQAGGRVQFVDCNREDLCVSYDDFVAKAERFHPKAAWVVHIGGHIAFEIEKISAYCKEQNIWLLEDCAHAHGAEWHGRKPGSWGDAGTYSFYATKTISTGEGGMLVTRHEAMAQFARSFRNYGKPDHRGQGLNFRMNEFTAALGILQVQRLPEIVTWKQEYARTVLDPAHPHRIRFPEGMKSGYYKYIVFDEIERSTGKVYDTPCHRTLQHSVELPNAEWVARNHWCVPLYYRPELVNGSEESSP